MIWSPTSTTPPIKISFKTNRNPKKKKKKKQQKSKPNNTHKSLWKFPMKSPKNPNKNPRKTSKNPSQTTHKSLWKFPMKSPKNLNRKFEKCLKQKVTYGNKKVNGFVVGIFASDGEVSALYDLPIIRRDLLPEIIETLNRILQLLPQPIHHGGLGPIHSTSSLTLISLSSWEWGTCRCPCRIRGPSRPWRCGERGFWDRETQRREGEMK